MLINWINLKETDELLDTIFQIESKDYKNITRS